MSIGSGSKKDSCVSLCSSLFFQAKKAWRPMFLVLAAMPIVDVSNANNLNTVEVNNCVESCLNSEQNTTEATCAIEPDQEKAVNVDGSTTEVQEKPIYDNISESAMDVFATERAVGGNDHFKANSSKGRRNSVPLESPSTSLPKAAKKSNSSSVIVGKNNKFIPFRSTTSRPTTTSPAAVTKTTGSAEESKKKETRKGIEVKKGTQSYCLRTAPAKKEVPVKTSSLPVLYSSLDKKPATVAKNVNQKVPESPKPAPKEETKDNKIQEHEATAEGNANEVEVTLPPSDAKEDQKIDTSPTETPVTINFFQEHEKSEEHDENVDVNDEETIESKPSAATIIPTTLNEGNKSQYHSVQVTSEESSNENENFIFVEDHTTNWKAGEDASFVADEANNLNEDEAAVNFVQGEANNSKEGEAANFVEEKAENSKENDAEEASNSKEKGEAANFIKSEAANLVTNDPSNLVEGEAAELVHDETANIVKKETAPLVVEEAANFEDEVADYERREAAILDENQKVAFCNILEVIAGDHNNDNETVAGSNTVSSECDSEEKPQFDGIVTIEHEVLMKKRESVENAENKLIFGEMKDIANKSSPISQEKENHTPETEQSDSSHVSSVAHDEIKTEDKQPEQVSALEPMSHELQTAVADSSEAPDHIRGTVKKGMVSRMSRFFRGIFQRSSQR